MGMIFAVLGQSVQLYAFVVLVRVLSSWIPNLDPTNPVVDMLYRVTDPVMEPARRLIPPIGMVDISPIVVFFGLQMLSGLLMNMATGF